MMPAAVRRKYCFHPTLLVRTHININIIIITTITIVTRQKHEFFFFIIIIIINLNWCLERRRSKGRKPKRVHFIIIAFHSWFPFAWYVCFCGFGNFSTLFIHPFLFTLNPLPSPFPRASPRASTPIPLPYFYPPPSAVHDFLHFKIFNLISILLFYPFPYQPFFFFFHN